MECNTVRFTVAEFCGKRGAFDAPAEFQRQGDAWSREKKQLFLDTLFSGYDASKFYLQVIEANSGMRDWQVVDGKQRIQCMWDFVDGKVSLGEGFNWKPTDNYGRGQKPYPKAGDKFSDLSEYWQAQFLGVNLDVVMIRGAEEADIGAMFMRLNNGESVMRV